MRAHTVILGAGATIAAIPNGDKNGRHSSVMNGLIEKLALQDILAGVNLSTKSKIWKIFILNLIQGRIVKR